MTEGVSRAITYVLELVINHFWEAVILAAIFVVLNFWNRLYRLETKLRETHALLKQKGIITTEEYYAVKLPRGKY